MPKSAPLENSKIIIDDLQFIRRPEGYPEYPDGLSNQKWVMLGIVLYVSKLRKANPALRNALSSNGTDIALENPDFFRNNSSQNDVGAKGASFAHTKTHLLTPSI
jgi:hypothetical protein